MRTRLAILSKYQGRFNAYEDKDDAITDSVFLRVFTQYHLEFNLALITQDRLLAQDILNIAKQNNAGNNAKLIEVYTIDDKGNITPVSD